MNYQNSGTRHRPSLVAAAPSSAGHPQHRIVIAADMQDFSAKPNPAQRVVRKALPDCLAQAFRRAGVDWAGCDYGDRGDGAMIVLPAGADPVPVLRPVPELLAEAIQHHNDRSAGDERFRLRLAVNIGTVHDDKPGCTGTAINDTARLVDSRPLREVLARTSVPLAMAVSASVHKDLVQHGYAGIDPRSFVDFRARVKKTKVAGSIYVPFAPARTVRRIVWMRVAGRYLVAAGSSVVLGAATLVLVLGDMSSQGGTDRLYVEVPQGRGWGAAEEGRRTLTVCDTASNGRGMRMEYVVLGSSEVRSFGDGNGSEPPCRIVHTGQPATTIRVCESESGSEGKPPAERRDLCSSWTQE